MLVVASLDPAAGEGLKGLEGVFHEAMHQWDDAIFSALSTEARRQHTTVPDALSHAMIFFTAGEAVRSVEPSHVPYAETEGVWARGMGSLQRALEAAWKPYLDGHGTREEAISALVKAVHCVARLRPERLDVLVGCVPWSALEAHKAEALQA